MERESKSTATASAHHEAIHRPSPLFPPHHPSRGSDHPQAHGSEIEWSPNSWRMDRAALELMVVGSSQP
uniref:Uncharacterized protein n=1 Tax=Oryza meridionalis TaxID=40149 RepID=A0A0E0E0M9_9ORYZ